jgi:hypothetical protein
VTLKLKGSWATSATPRSLQLSTSPASSSVDDQPIPQLDNRLSYLGLKFGQRICHTKLAEHSGTGQSLLSLTLRFLEQ